MSLLADKLAAALKAQERRLARRRLPEPPSATLSEIDFTSNDYLSLSTSPALRTAILSALSTSPKILGSGGSRLLVPCPPHVELEARLSRFFGAEAAIWKKGQQPAKINCQFRTMSSPVTLCFYIGNIVYVAHHTGFVAQ